MDHTGYNIHFCLDSVEFMQWAEWVLITWEKSCGLKKLFYQNFKTKDDNFDIKAKDECYLYLKSLYTGIAAMQGPVEFAKEFYRFHEELNESNSQYIHQTAVISFPQ